LIFIKRDDKIPDGGSNSNIAKSLTTKGSMGEANKIKFPKRDSNPQTTIESGRAATGIVLYHFLFLRLLQGLDSRRAPSSLWSMCPIFVGHFMFFLP
jgi:hypothetical protein